MNTSRHLSITTFGETAFSFRFLEVFCYRGKGAVDCAEHLLRSNGSYCICSAMYDVLGLSSIVLVGRMLPEIHDGDFSPGGTI